MLSSRRLFLLFSLTVTSLAGCSGSSSQDNTTTSSSNSSASSLPSTPQSCSSSTALIIDSITENDSDENNGAAKAIDYNLSPESRWSSLGDGKSITLDMGTQATITEVKTAWHKHDERTSFYELEASTDETDWVNLVANGQSENTQLFTSATFDEVTARYIRLIGHGNSNDLWNDLIEVEVYGCDGLEVASAQPSGALEPTDLSPLSPPSDNFDLSRWYLSVPSDNDNNGNADSIKEKQLNNGYENPDYFFTGDDGGMVFRVYPTGFKTSANTSYTRTELREMLRAGDTSIDTKGVNANNWVFGSAPASDRAKAGGIDGNMRATLAVNRVSTTGENYQVGRVIIGQIHANDDEPIRLYYRKLPDNSKGALYFAHEIKDGDDQWHSLIGSRSDQAADPSDGIALNEIFSYEIDVRGNTLSVHIYREGQPTISKSISMRDSGYDQGGQYMYFKAGAYNQNNSGEDTDYTQVTFYALEQRHN
ncbi:polysaccharide lyase family 7 protein [Gilvimarinus sp. DA14]|uniref:polysaccharide lyase family 7 protein n=1 Tax=Gilvimarinus sp. DA14 TaxID=2956798 RepID=UPI0020B6D571|nr:polysaccharide lyase family 7 protein [Gilvimarinus sp. DA14]UTF61017.1 polysaccharide lyase family 7 protein [Gilvimarinus sp. DA14]